jgi:hypothetical protein
MKCKIRGHEIEGSPEEIVKVIKLLSGDEEQNITYIPYPVPNHPPYWPTNPYTDPYIVWTDTNVVTM